MAPRAEDADGARTPGQDLPHPHHHHHHHHHLPSAPPHEAEPDVRPQASLATAKSSPVIKAVRSVSAEKAAALETLIRGSWAPNAVYSLCRLGVPDALTDDPAAAATAADLADRLRCNAPCLLRLLRLCAAYGLLAEVPRQQASDDNGGGGGGGGGSDGNDDDGFDTDRRSGARAAAGSVVEGGEGKDSEGVGRLDGNGREAPQNGSSNDSNGSNISRSSCSSSSSNREEVTAFYLTESGMMLQESHPSQMKWLALMLGLPGHYVSRGFLYDNVKEGRMGFEAAFGRDWYGYIADQPLEAAAFDKAMTATSAAAAQGVAQAYDFSRHGTVLDVGGGQGLLMAAILTHHPGVRRGFVMELPNVVERARRMGQRGLERLAGNFFEPFPLVADCILMRLVLHDWPDSQAAAILRRAQAALDQGPASRLVVVEAVLPEVVGPGADATTLQQLEFDMGMMVMTSGRERSRGEWEALFARSGFRLAQLLMPRTAKLPVMVLERDGQPQEQEREQEQEPKVIS